MATLSNNNIAEAVYEASKGKTGKELDAILFSTTKMLSLKHLLGRAPDILKSLESIFDKDEHIVRAKVESSHELSRGIEDEIKDELKKRYHAEHVYIETILNKSLLGGIKIQVGDEVIDLTLRNKINQLQNYLIAN